MTYNHKIFYDLNNDCVVIDGRSDEDIEEERQARDMEAPAAAVPLRSCL
jgi:hypothetical protein